MKLRTLLEYRATEFITFPTMYKNMDYSPRWKKYLENIPEGVIVPEKDIPMLKEELSAGHSLRNYA